MSLGNFKETPPNEATKLSRRDLLKKAGLTALAISGLEKTTEAQVENKFINKDGNCEFMFTSPNANEAHNSANRFATEVGNILKSAYPSRRVLNPSVRLEILTSNNQKLYRLIWKCNIVKSSTGDADYYFDRRGTLLPGKTLEEAKDKVEAELQKSGKVEEMRKRFGGRGKIYESFIRDSSAGSEKDGYWYIKEFFLVAQK